MKKFIFRLSFTLGCLLFTCSLFSQTTPDNLAAYYGWPLDVNGETTKNGIVNVFKKYDMVVFGADLETNLTGTDATLFSDIVNDLQNSHGVEIFGYITIGVTNLDGTAKNYPMTELKQRVDKWGVYDVKGIFLDEGGADFGVSRARQDDIVEYIHTQSKMVMMNAWNPADVLSGSPQLGGNASIKDYYLLESFMVQMPKGYVDFDASRGRYQDARNFDDDPARNLGVVTLTTTSNCSFFSCQFDYAWWATLAYGFDAMGWGEKNFSSSAAASAMENQLPFRSRPSVNPMPKVGSGQPNYANGILTRQTSIPTNGLITINTKAYTIEYKQGTNIIFEIDDLEKDCGPLLVMNNCIKKGDLESGIYVKSAEKGISDCECYNQITGKNSINSLLKMGGAWYLMFAPDCIFKPGVGGGLIQTIPGCDPTDLNCVK